MPQLPIWLCILIAVLVAAVCSRFLCGWNHRKKVAEDAIGGAEQEAKRIVSDAIKKSRGSEEEGNGARGQRRDPSPAQRI